MSTYSQRPVIQDSVHTGSLQTLIMDIHPAEYKYVSGGLCHPPDSNITELGILLTVFGFVDFFIAGGVTVLSMLSTCSSEQAEKGCCDESDNSSITTELVFTGIGLLAMIVGIGLRSTVTREYGP